MRFSPTHVRTLMMNDSDDPTEGRRQGIDVLRSLLAVILARMAGARYRKWSEAAGAERYRYRLLECAERAEEIARAVEAVYPNAAVMQAEILRRHRDLAAIDAAPFGGQPWDAQLSIQAHRATSSALLWAGIAEHERDSSRNRVFRACADLEEINAICLEVILRGRASPA